MLSSNSTDNATDDTTDSTSVTDATDVLTDRQTITASTSWQRQNCKDLARIEHKLGILENYLPERTSVRKPLSRTKDKARTKVTTSFTSKIGLISRNRLLLNLR